MSGKERSPFKVMLVEDDDSFRHSVAGLLISRFPSIVLREASDAAEAMKMAESFLPHLIFMDIKLPGESGMEVTRTIKALHPDIHVVMLTSYDFPEYREVAHACGACGFLSKGTSTAEEIQGLVKELCDRHAA